MGLAALERHPNIRHVSRQRLVVRTLKFVNINETELTEEYGNEEEHVEGDVEGVEVDGEGVVERSENGGSSDGKVEEGDEEEIASVKFQPPRRSFTLVGKVHRD